ncbi:MAG: helix-turn-helix transcriptional regulator [Lachnospiraceae bacterium]|nr:helix-turn-helix transcriptional regulator [Lachnospiraceae bacterium]
MQMPPPLFASEFFDSLISSETSNRFSLSEYFKGSYERTFDFCQSLPYVLCMRAVSVTAPFSYASSDLDAYCLLHTTNGAGKLHCLDHTQAPITYELLPGTLSFIDCSKEHKLSCSPNSWEYSICFVSRHFTSYYYHKLTSSGGCVFNLNDDPDSYSIWKRLWKAEDNDEIHGIMRARELVSLFTQLYLLHARAETGSYHIPAYIVDIKKRFDTAYQEQYSLEQLAGHYHANKYTLARHFMKYCGETPLQYLCNVRIEKAKEMLLHTDEKIGSIAEKCGFRNFNHFLRIFKTKTGVSPSVYRKETPIL